MKGRSGFGSPCFDGGMSSDDVLLQKGALSLADQFVLLGFAAGCVVNKFIYVNRKVCRI